MVYGIERLAAHRQNQRRLLSTLETGPGQDGIKNKAGQYEEAVS